MADLEIYNIAAIARRKLLYEFNDKDHKLHRLVAHANLYDHLLEIYYAPASATAVAATSVPDAQETAIGSHGVQVTQTVTCVASCAVDDYDYDCEDEELLGVVYEVASRAQQVSLWGPNWQKKKTQPASKQQRKQAQQQQPRPQKQRQQFYHYDAQFVSEFNHCEDMDKAGSMNVSVVEVGA